MPDGIEGLFTEMLKTPPYIGPEMWTASDFVESMIWEWESERCSWMVETNLDLAFVSFGPRGRGRMGFALQASLSMGMALGFANILFMCWPVLQFIYCGVPINGLNVFMAQHLHNLMCRDTLVWKGLDHYQIINFNWRNLVSHAGTGSHVCLLLTTAGERTQQTSVKVHYIELVWIKTYLNLAVNNLRIKL